MLIVDKGIGAVKINKETQIVEFKCKNKHWRLCNYLDTQMTTQVKFFKNQYQDKKSVNMKTGPRSVT